MVVIDMQNELNIKNVFSSKNSAQFLIKNFKKIRLFIFCLFSFGIKIVLCSL